MTCSWYRSMTSVFRRRRLSSTSCRMRSGRGVVAFHLAGCLVEHLAELGGKDHLTASTRNGLPEHAFAVAAAVDRGRVEEGDPQVQGTLDGADGFVIIDISPADGLSILPERSADGPAAHSHGADLDAASSKRSSEGCHFRNSIS